MKDGETGGEVLLVEKETDRVLEGEGLEERVLTVGQLEHESKRLRRQLTKLFPSLIHKHRIQ